MVAYKTNMASFMELNSKDLLSMCGEEKALEDLYVKYDNFENQ